MRKKSSGFTLIELLVAVGLMVILITSIVLIFHRSTDVMNINNARLQIFENARAAIDTVANDLQNASRLESETQRFCLKDFVRPAASGGPGTGTNTEGARDYMGFVTVATAPSGNTREVKPVFVEYFLRGGDDAETSFTGTGFTSGIRSKRAIFALVRRSWEPPNAIGTADPLRNELLTAVPLASSAYASTISAPTPLPATPWSYKTIKLQEEGELCQWVVSMNIEACFAPTAAGTAPAPYMQLDAGPTSDFRSSDFPLIGPAAQTQAGVTQITKIPRKMKISFRVIEGAAERQERLIEREIWIPAAE